MQQTCLREAIPDAGCDIEDTACQCLESTQAKLRTLAAPCFLRECDPDEIIEAQRAGAAACEALASASESRTVSDQGTTGTMSILPTDVLPPVSTPSTPEVPSITTISSIVTPPSGNTTTTRTTTSDDSNETGGSGGGGDNTAGGEETTTSTDAAPMATAGLVAALLAAAVAI